MFSGFKKVAIGLLCAFVLIAIVTIMHVTSSRRQETSEPAVYQKQVISCPGDKEKQHNESRGADTDLRDKLCVPPGPFLGTGHIPEIFAYMDVFEAQQLFHSNMMLTAYNCKNIRRFGNRLDGGYDVCADKTFEPEKNKCLVYSFGIRDEWSFDDHINKDYGCDVHSFDPSMKQKDHMHREPNMYFYKLGIWGSNMVNDQGWKLQDLATIVKSLGHENRVIDYLKIDVEGAEWPLLTHLVTTDIHKQVKQLALEIHTPRWKIHGQEMAPIDYGEIYYGLKQLERLGFKKFVHHTNNGCCGRFVDLTIVGKRRLCCYETFYVNTNFIK